MSSKRKPEKKWGKEFGIQRENKEAIEFEVTKQKWERITAPEDDDRGGGCDLLGLGERHVEP